MGKGRHGMAKPLTAGNRKKRRKILGSLFSQEEQAISLIGEGISVLGTLDFGDGVVRLDGNLEGKMIGRGTLIIGQTGCLLGEMNVGTLFLCGRVEGTVVALERIHILRSGKLAGKVKTAQLIIDEGGILEGESEPLLQEAPLVPFS